MRLTTTEIQYMATFETLTGVVTKDCIVDGNEIVFVVKEGQVGLAVGKGGQNIKRIQQLLGKKIYVVEYANNPRDFVRNILYPARVTSVNLVEKNGKKFLYVSVDPRDRPIVRAKKGFKLKLARTLLNRHFGIHNVIIS